MLIGLILTGCTAEETHCCWTDLAIGLEHSCGLREDGEVWCWGDDPDIPDGRRVAEEGEFRALAGSTTHGTCGVTDEDTVECWGGGAFLDYLDSMPRTGISTLAISGKASGLPADTCFDGPARGWTLFLGDNTALGRECIEQGHCQEADPSLPEVERMQCSPYGRSGGRNGVGVGRTVDGRWQAIQVVDHDDVTGWSMAVWEVSERHGYLTDESSCLDAEWRSETLDPTDVQQVSVVANEAWNFATLTAGGQPGWSLRNDPGDGASDSVGSSVCSMSDSYITARYPFRHDRGYIDVATNLDEACYLHAGGDIDCWNLDEREKRQLRYEDRTMVRLFGGGKVFCALDEDGALECFGDNEHSQTVVPDEP